MIYIRPLFLFVLASFNDDCRIHTLYIIEEVGEWSASKDSEAN
jgi:hypothetical protein